MVKDNRGKKSLVAMAAVLGASVGMNAVIADARGIEAGEGESDASAAAEVSPISVAQDINVRREAFPSGRGATRRPSNQLKIDRQSPRRLKLQKRPSNQFKLGTKRNAPKAGAYRPPAGNRSAPLVKQPAKIYKLPPPPAPFVPTPLPNKPKRTTQFKK